MKCVDFTAMMPIDFLRDRFLGQLDLGEGPCPVLVAEGILHDMSRVVPTVSQLVEAGEFDVAAGAVDVAAGAGVRPLDAVIVGGATLLSPIDIQSVKACGVTFAVSATKRVIEERARGDAVAAAAFRDQPEARIGGSIRSVFPGSAEGTALKAALIDEDVWSQCLAVAIGPDAEVLIKTPVLATFGAGAALGVRSHYIWNNPEPEIVLLVTAEGSPVGATLGNDVNLCDFEGRSALLLGKAKDNNASCALGPFVRLFGADFTVNDVRAANLSLLIEGEDGHRLDCASSMHEITRDPLDLVRKTLSEQQYPDGFALFLGTLFAPTHDREGPGLGFAHKVGDIVTVASARLGTLINRVAISREAPPWTDGIATLMRNLARRGALAA